MSPTYVASSVFAFVAVALLVACTPAEEQARIDRLQTNPEITVVGEFDGCTVKYVNRHYDSRSFYLAKCADTTTTTRQFSEPQGKSRVHRTRVDITQQMQALQKEADELDAKEKALAKLSKEERAALGLKN